MPFARGAGSEGYENKENGNWANPDPEYDEPYHAPGHGAKERERSMHLRMHLRGLNGEERVQRHMVDLSNERLLYLSLSLSQYRPCIQGLGSRKAEVSGILGAFFFDKVMGGGVGKSVWEIRVCIVEREPISV